jgi:penicillin-binding protein 1B
LTPLKAIREVVSGSGKRLQRYPFETKQVVDPAATYLTNTILQEVVREGTAKAAYKSLPKKWAVAGKTGTSNDLKDSWFAGFSGDYLTVVWVGRDDNQPMGLTGASGALPIWTAVMRQIVNQSVELMPPDTIEQVWIDARNGLLADEKCLTAQQFPYVIGSAPTEVSSCGETQNPKTNDADTVSVETPTEPPPSQPSTPPAFKPWFNKLY